MRLILNASFLLIFFHTVLIAQSTAEQVNSLRGLKGVTVTVELHSRELHQPNLRNLLQSTSASRLTDAGIRVLPDTLTGHAPVLKIIVFITKGLEDSGYAIRFDIRLEQDVILARDHSISVTKVPTWESGNIGVASGGLEVGLPDIIGAQIERFAADFLVANRNGANDSTLGKRK